LQIQLICGNGDCWQISTDAVIYITPSTSLIESGTNSLYQGITKKAGSKLLEECKKIQYCSLGDAITTKAYNLPAKYIIHGVAPAYGIYGEKYKYGIYDKEQVKGILEKTCKSIVDELNTKPDVQTINIEFLWRPGFFEAIREFSILQTLQQYKLCHVNTINIICPKPRCVKTWQNVFQHNKLSFIDNVILVERISKISKDWDKIFKLCGFIFVETQKIDFPNEYNIAFPDKFKKEIWKRKTKD